MSYMIITLLLRHIVLLYLNRVGDIEEGIVIPSSFYYSLKAAISLYVLFLVILFIYSIEDTFHNEGYKITNIHYIIL